MERPIIFGAESVRAILTGRKTQTRRLVFTGREGRPGYSRDTWDATGCDFVDHFSGNIVRIPWTPSRIEQQITCPYGMPGDRLWVRETWALVPTTAYRASDVIQTVCHDFPDSAAVYRAGWPLSPPSRWRSPIHMPRWASRILLTITSVRVERVQDISTHDIEREGLARGMSGDGRSYDEAMRAWWIERWDGINGNRAPWASNPWVWAISFEVTP